ncbi:MAG: DUF4340 domain-containing protein [Anaerolineales bacterium]|jgi:hypothetical protein
MIKRPTWILLVILALVVVAYFVMKGQGIGTFSSSTPTATATNFLITPSDGTLQVLRITDAKEHIFQMQRDTSGTWVVTLPTTGTADQSLAGAAETQVGALRIVTTLDNSLNLSDAGLNTPADTIELTFVNNVKHTIQVGILTPTGSGYYVRFDTGNLYVVSHAGVDALLNLLTAPPFPATETPTSTVAETATPTLVIATPSPSLETVTSTP